VQGDGPSEARQRVHDAIAARLVELPASQWLTWQRREDIAWAAAEAAVITLHE
jgi:hypothetical protein